MKVDPAPLLVRVWHDPSSDRLRHSRMLYSPEVALRRARSLAIPVKYMMPAEAQKLGAIEQPPD